MFSHWKYMGANEPQAGAIIHPRGMTGRIYVEHYLTLLHTFICKLWVLWFQAEDFFHVFPIIYTILIAYGRYRRPRAWPIWTPGAWLPGFIKGTTSHCYTQNMIIALGFVVSN